MTDLTRKRTGQRDGPVQLNSTEDVDTEAAFVDMSLDQVMTVTSEEDLVGKPESRSASHFDIGASNC